MHLGVESFTLVGHSLGANVALAYAGMHCDRLRSLALLHPVTQGHGPIAWLGRAYYRAGVLLPRWLARPWLTSRLLVFLSDQVVLTTRDRDRRRAILQADYRTAAMASPRAIAEVYASFAQTPFTELCHHVTVPTLVVTGTRDALARPEAITDIHQRIQGSTVALIDGAGHLWPAEFPQAAAHLVEQALFRARDRAAGKRAASGTPVVHASSEPIAAAPMPPS
jgi:pimeloyl-ACP methyl ester carboxylesterase